MPPDWGFGNRILFYNNLRQRAAAEGIGWSSIPWKGSEYFEGVSNNVHISGGVSLKPCLGEKFFAWHTMSTRDIFKFKDPNPDQFVPSANVAVHFRGGDFHEWNIDAVLDTEYYINSINSVLNTVNHFYLFTDDESLTSYQTVVKYLKEMGASYSTGENLRSSYINDFKTMTECDYIISSPSTYCICAGFIGRYKKIIHSQKWIDNRVSVNDKFWVDLKNGGNKDYSIWRLV